MVNCWIRVHVLWTGNGPYNEVHYKGLSPELERIHEAKQGNIFFFFRMDKRN